MSNTTSWPVKKEDGAISSPSRIILGRQACLVLVLFLVFIFPFPPQLFGFVGEFFGLIVCLSVLGLFLLFTKAKIYLPSLFICGLLFSLLIGSLLRDSENSILRDFFELLRPLFWFVIFSLFYGVFGGNKSDQSLRLMTTFTLFIAVWGILEVLLPLPSAYSYIYRLPGSVYYDKAIASLVAPYAYAAVVGIGAIFFFAKSKIQNKSKNLWFSIICMVAIALSQSKSGIFGIILVITLMQMSYNKTAGFILLVPSFFMAGSYVYLSGGLSYVTNFVGNVIAAYSRGGFSSLLGASPSIGNRVQQFQEVILYLDPIFLFGRGIGKDYLYLESSLSLILFRYGISGFMLILLVFYAALRQLKRLRGRLQSPDWISLDHSFSYLFIYLCIVSLSANLIDQFKVAFFYIGILGLLFAKGSVLRFSNSKMRRTHISSRGATIK